MVVVVVLIYFVIIGILRGGVREITSIAALLGGFYAAYLYYEPFSGVFSVFIETVYLRHIVGFVVLFAMVAIALTLIGAVLRAFLKLVLLGMVDRLMGGVIGAVKAIIVLSVLHFLALTFLPPGGAAVAEKSRIAPSVNSAAAFIVYLVPEEVKREMASSVQQLRFAWESRQDEGDGGFPPP